ncbi:hypothetical protein ACSHT0_07370 [Tepidicaulis sp. LMO-SS28]|uniref:hypothetical protein n=1 Tax=Tepidicaulis sp. LMO-SS28 TaxID=3447455 RepID=UPI003EE21593
MQKQKATVIPVRYESGSGELMVFGGSFAGLFLASLAIARLDLIFAAATLICFAVAFYHLPLVLRRRPPLLLHPEGLEIEGLGLLPWEQIAGIRLYNRAVRTIRNAEMYLILNAPLERALARTIDPEDAKSALPGRRYMFSICKILSEGELTLRLEPLAVSPEQLGDVIRARIAAARKAAREAKYKT